MPTIVTQTQTPHQTRWTPDAKDCSTTALQGMQNEMTAQPKKNQYTPTRPTKITSVTQTLAQDQTQTQHQTRWKLDYACASTAKVGMPYWGAAGGFWELL